MSRILVVVGISAMALSACSSTPVASVEPIDGVISGQCHTDSVRGAAGLAAAPGTVERARVDSDSLGVSVVRGQRGRNDANVGASAGGDHLTIEIGPTNNITALRCG
ncbi:hypothetical protein ARC78_02475 [Stenotrophomonas pictorum JCM 9942]|uniref:Lipoprotein n=1 Tax=Stenotrophomonas pictorum JCM 9942 TaxID=1236960 RepID=A0A0Q9ZWY0_9GAMM|nr:hypothetical protein [Stenotrophomonas pictorum]KRG37356.1 hypothetical protein ARC78_02475 [Stenotrophomonas pictorum JCM 9942]